MKRLYLRFEHRPADSDPIMYTVVMDLGTTLILSTKRFGTAEEETFTKNADGTFTNVHGVRFVKATIDRRPKPYSVESREEGRGPKTVRKFATVEEIREYVKGRWQGWDYYDGDNSFHGDYATFTVIGVNLADLVPPREEFEREAFFAKMNELHPEQN